MPIKDLVARAAYNAQRYQSRKTLTRKAHADYYQRNKAQIKAATKKWKTEHHDQVLVLERAGYQRNIEKRREYQHGYAVEHKPEIAERSGRRYAAQRERILLINSKWRKSNPDKVKQYQAENRKRHAGRVNANNAKRRAARIQATPPWLTAEQFKRIEKFYIEAKRLEQADGVARHVDHIYPLIGKTCRGLHVPWNLQILTATENLYKLAKMPETVRRLP
jgi:hypothetical protein